MEVSELGLTSLQGSEYFPNITQLRCIGNSLKTLDVAKNQNLILITCVSNQLTEINVSKNMNLETLLCYDNALTELDLSGCTNMVSLDCSDNQLTELDVSKNGNLMRLQCKNNQLTKLDLSNNPKLIEVYCPGNQLLELDLSNNPDVTLGWFDFKAQTRSMEIPVSETQSFDLSTLIDDWSKVSNVKAQNAVLKNDGKTVSWKNGAENPTVHYNYHVDDNGTIITVTLTLNYTPEILPYVPSVPDKEPDDTEDTASDGWIQWNGTWYYLDPKSGAMQTGWKYVNGEWYYLRDWGGMATGWIRLNGKWYYLNENGAMAYNTTIEGYFLGADGAMR